MKTSHGSECVTAGVRVRVSPSYVAGESSPDENRYVFAYRIEITNENPYAVQLLTRAWRIVDAAGEANVVRGDGVVGQQPALKPGAVHTYSSYCPLSTRWGTMEGTYGFVRCDDAEPFEVAVERFYLVMPDDPSAA